MLNFSFAKTACFYFTVNLAARYKSITFSKLQVENSFSKII